MPGNTFGTLFRLTSFGESHGPAVGGVIDGCPAGLSLDLDRVRHDLARRRPGQSHVSSARNESEEFEILSGLYEGQTTGAPLAFMIRNKDAISSDYDSIRDVFRPSHADYTYEAKYGIRDHRGGGRSSARETAVRVFAGAVARQLLDLKGIEILAFVSAIGNISAEISHAGLDTAKIERSPLRCPDTEADRKMLTLLEDLKREGDTTGGIITCLIRNAPAGLGEPVFAKLQADLAASCMSINAAHGFEYGSGFAGTSMKGSEHNDPFETDDTGRIVTSSNYSGGIQGGISNGMDIYFRVAFKPVSTLMRDQQSIDKSGKPVKINPGGRHDPCVVPRAVPIVEAMSALVLADHLLRNSNSKLNSL
jgi:chorismate synthase